MLMLMLMLRVRVRVRVLMVNVPIDVIGIDCFPFRSVSHLGVFKWIHVDSGVL